MNHDSTDLEALSSEDGVSPNDDGCVLGTAGRDEDPNATTDWDHPQSAESIEKTPQQPGTDQAQDVPLPPNGTPGIDTVPIKPDSGAD
jgi:hypothetical protein